MFLNIFINRLKCTIRDKDLIFWTMIFPLIMATFFNLAFSNISKHESFKSVDVAVVNDSQYQKDKNFQNFISQLSTEETGSGNNIKLLNLKLAGTREEADKMLENGEIIGYITDGPTIGLTVKNSGFSQTMVKSVLDEYGQTVSVVGSIISRNPSAIQEGLMEDIGSRKEYTRDIQLGTTNNPDSTVNYFYALLAMTCFYGAFFGLKEITDSQADLSKRAARLNVAPVHKLKLLVAGLCAGFVVLLAENAILMAYLIFVIKIDFGNQIGYIILTCLAGCLAGITYGAFLGALIKKGEGVKTAILIATTMLASFLSGMMFQNMKYIIEKNVPILSYINPVSLITDAFYALYYYDTHTRFFINIGVLCGFTVFFCTATYLIIRRQRYASI